LIVGVDVLLYSSTDILEYLIYNTDDKIGVIPLKVVNEHR
jgi:hypothetical protein